MRLACIFIPRNKLPNVFGEGHEEQILNLGGEFIYSFEYSKRNGQYKVDRKKNEDFVDLFWSDKISLISAIIGKNGVGKTSILRAINEGDSLHVGTLELYESISEDVLFVKNNTDKVFIAPTIKIEKIEQKDVQKLYYSPVLDQDLVGTNSPITLVSHLHSSIEEFHFESILRNLLLFREPFIESILSVYPDFPYYDRYLVSVYPLRQNHFIDTYISSNLGNPFRSEVLRNHIEGDLLRLKSRDRKGPYAKDDLISYLKDYLNIINSESFTNLFLRLWEQEEYYSKNDMNFVNVTGDFFKNLEVTLLSYLLLGAIFPQTGLGKNLDFDFEEFLEEKQFYEKLDLLLRFYIQSEDELIYTKLKEKIGINFLESTNELIELIKKDKLTRVSGLDYNAIKNRIIRHILRFRSVKEFYEFLINASSKNKFHTEKDVLIFDLGSPDVIESYENFVEKYYELLKHFNHLPVKPQILRFDPNRRLSSGEKSLINFFASLNHYLDFGLMRKGNSNSNYLLLLDEAELGFHPIWKKKFINALVNVIPQIFSKIPKEKKDEKDYIESLPTPKVQIILSTHDPLTLSDLPQANIIYLDKAGSVSSMVEKGEQNRKNSFGANITDLLADSFFVEDGLIGEFALTKINETITWLNNKDDKNNTEYHRKIIQIIDEPVIRRKLSELFAEKMDDEFSIEILRQEIDNLMKRFKDKTGEDYDLS